VPSDKPIAIVGFMGCGKTAVARMVAAHLERPMADLDELIIERHGRTPAEIISGDGESAFRSVETNRLRELLNSGFVGVLSLGGGAWIESANRKLLAEKEALTIWLDTPFDVCWQRIEAAEEIRPLAPTREQAKLLFDQRCETYALAKIHLKSSTNEGLDSVALRVKSVIQKFDRP
jgi:shikimate kinase